MKVTRVIPFFLFPPLSSFYPSRIAGEQAGYTWPFDRKAANSQSLLASVEEARSLSASQMSTHFLVSHSWKIFSHVRSHLVQVRDVFLLLYCIL